MKVFLLFLLITLSFVYNYNPDEAINYARKYCLDYNPNYPSYKNIGADCANFVSQCLIAGGFSFDGCQNVKYGVITGCTSLLNCLKKKGWKDYTEKPPGFRGGYPMIRLDKGHAVMATEVSGSTIKYAGHTQDCCDRTLKYGVYYMMPPN